MESHFTTKKIILFLVSIILTYAIIDWLLANALVQSWPNFLLEVIGTTFLGTVFHILFIEKQKEKQKKLKPFSWVIFLVGLSLFFLISILPIYLQIASEIWKTGSILIGVLVMLVFFRLNSKS